MATVSSCCPNCGGQMRIDSNLLSCSFCGTQVLNIVDANVDLFEDTISADEFAKQIQKSRTAFVINTGKDANPNLSVMDVEKKVLRQHIQNAMLLLENRKYSEVLSELSGCDSDVFSVQRLRFLPQVIELV